jgi:hypothetical protein
MPYGGFMATWGSYESDWVYKYSTMTTSILNYWKPAKNIGVYSAPVDKIVAQTFDSQISFFMSTSVSNTFTLYHRKFDLGTKVWTSDSTLFTRTNWLPRGEMSFDLGKNWHSVLGFGLLENGATNGAAYLVDINMSVPGPAQMVASTDQEQGLLLTGLSVNPDDSISFATTGMLNLRPYLKRVKAGVELLNVAVPTIADNQYLGFKGIATSNGNLYFLTAAGYTMRDAIVYVQATAPAASANASVRGTPRNGSKLTAGTVNFSSVSGIGVTTRQWYSCSRAVPANTTVKPSTCSAISKATGSTFKVTSKQRGKYITVAVKNSNAVGTTTLFAPASSKAK